MGNRAVATLCLALSGCLASPAETAITFPDAALDHLDSDGVWRGTRPSPNGRGVARGTFVAVGSSSCTGWHLREPTRDVVAVEFARGVVELEAWECGDVVVPWVIEWRRE